MTTFAFLKNNFGSGMRMNWGLLVGKAGEELDIEDKQNMWTLQYLVSD